MNQNEGMIQMMSSTPFKILRTRNFFRAAAALAALSVAVPSQAQQTVPHQERARGVLTGVSATEMVFAGEGRATHFGRYTIVGSHDFDQLGNITNGQFTTTAADGSTISGIYSGSYTALPGGAVRFDVVVDWLVGTKRLEGVTGQAPVVAVLDGVAPGAAFEYFTDGFLTFP